MATLTLRPVGLAQINEQTDHLPIVFGPQLQAPQYEIGSAISSRSSMTQFAALANASVEHQIVISYISIKAYRRTRRTAMKSLLHYDIQDVAVMVGAGSLAGAVANIIFSTISGSPAPQAVAMLVAATGFVGGRFLSAKLRNTDHG